MQIISHSKNNIRIAELVSNDILISKAEDGIQLLADLYYQGFELIVMLSSQLNPSFFELKSGLAGEVLQKYSNWRMRLTIIGNFNEVISQSLRDFIYESNKGKMVNFVNSIDEAIARA